jgi:hypothetical protein
MMQVYDRVLISRSEPTLLVLTVLVLGFFLLMGLLENFRSAVLIRVGNLLDDMLSKRVFNASFERNLRGGSTNAAQAMSDLTQLRQFFTGNGNENQTIQVNIRTATKDIENTNYEILVNGEFWSVKKHLYDLLPDEKGCIVKTGFDGGIVVIFGNGGFGMSPGSMWGAGSGTVPWGMGNNGGYWGGTGGFGGGMGGWGNGGMAAGAMAAWAAWAASEWEGIHNKIG